MATITPMSVKIPSDPKKFIFMLLEWGKFKFFTSNVRLTKALLLVNIVF